MDDGIHDDGASGRGGAAEAEAALRVARLGALARARRESLGMTVVRLSAVTGISRRFISEFEDGKPTAQLGRAVLVCEAVGIDLVEALRNHVSPGRPHAPAAPGAWADDELPEPDDDVPASPSP